LKQPGPLDGDPIDLFAEIPAEADAVEELMNRKKVVA
jgi:hypothetical protein